jgi:hypothetical protein
VCVQPAAVRVQVRHVVHQSPCPKRARSPSSHRHTGAVSVAVVYWGMPRALCSTNPSHRLHLYAPLEARGAAVRVYAHHFYRRDGTAGIWGGAPAPVERPSSNRARDARLDAQEMLVARCLAPNASRNVVVEEQDTYFAALNMSRYYGMSNRERITARGYAKYSKYRKRGEKG